MSRQLIIRADSGLEIGTGHVMRTIALAAAWRSKFGTAVFVMRPTNSDIERRVRHESDQLIPLDGLVSATAELEVVGQIVKRMHTSVIVLDGYHFDLGYQRALRKRGWRLVVIDDFNHLPEYDADILVNQNVDADRLPYHTSRDTRRLLGCRYALIRPEFLRRRPRGPLPTQGRRPLHALVTLGGVDRRNITAVVLRGLQRAESVRRGVVEASVVLGPANPHSSALTEEFGDHPRLGLLRSVQDMAELMRKTDVAITAGGSTCWELAYMRVPMGVVVLEENQRRIAEGLDREGAAVNLGWHNEIKEERVASFADHLAASPTLRRHLSKTAASLVDGRGALRVAEAIAAIADVPSHDV